MQMAASAPELTSQRWQMRTLKRTCVRDCWTRTPGAGSFRFSAWKKPLKSGRCGYGMLQFTQPYPSRKGGVKIH